MRFGDIDHLVLLGGARATVELALALRARRRHRCDVVTAPRQEVDTVNADGETFGGFLDRHGVPYRVVEDINLDQEFLDSITPTTLALGTGEAWSFTPGTIERLDGRLLDLMGIPLPQYRGGAHYTWQILAGNRRGACNLQVVNEDMRPGLFDSGSIIKRREYVFPTAARTPADYFAYASSQEVDFVLEFLEEVEQGTDFREQALQNTFSLHFPRLNTRQQAFIDWQWPTRDVERMICAFDVPYVGAATSVNGNLVRLGSARIETGDGPFHPFQRGLIYRIDVDQLFVATRDGTVLIGEVRDEEGRSVKDSLRVGDRFITPVDWIERGLSYRPSH